MTNKLRTNDDHCALNAAIQLAHEVQAEAFRFDGNDKLLALTDSLILMLSDIKEEREREEDFARCYRSEEEAEDGDEEP
ncbi:MAG TPA: hypothetical protein VIY48_09910 [Candidatus Paceibacterota bacterium]